MRKFKITIKKRNPDQTSYENLPKESHLAQWETDTTKWLSQLVDHQKAKQYVAVGYHDIYIAKAEDVLPLLKPTAPSDQPLVLDEADQSYWGKGKIFELFTDRITSCPADQMLDIEKLNIYSDP